MDRFLRGATALTLALSLCACTVTVGGDEGAAGSLSLVRDGQATLDFRERPAPGSLGLAGGRSTASYEGDPIDVTVLLPQGKTTHITAYALSVNTLAGADAPPAVVLVIARHDSARSLSEALWSQQGTLKLEETPLVHVAGEKGSASGSGVGIVPGLQEGFLTLDVDVRPSVGSRISAYYNFSFGLQQTGSGSPSAG